MGMRGQVHAVVYQREDGLWDWRVIASNGEIVAKSGGQGFTRQDDAVEGVLTAQDLMDTMREIRYA